MTPPQWLHMTTYVAGPAEQFTDEQMQRMTAVASDYLADVPPITVSLGKILYHREAIMLAVTPADDLAPIRAAALSATNAVTNSMSGGEATWTPHITLCYSTTEQAAQPVIPP
jgi:2'-5' RNA ligase superfamily